MKNKQLPIASIMLKAQGNPGAMQAYVDILQANPIEALQIVDRLDKCPSIVGTNLHVLYFDLCSKDIHKVFKLCTSDISNELLEDACNRQNYSGRELVKKYLK